MVLDFLAATLQKYFSMKKSLKIIENFVFHRSCHLCGSFDTEYEVICSGCWLKLLAHFQAMQNRNVGTIEVTALFAWIPGLGYDLGKFLHSCKKLKSQKAWRFISEEWIRRTAIRPTLSKNVKTVLVPIPSQKGRNHAYNFALALSDLTGFDVLPALRFEASDNLNSANLEQKYLSKNLRARRQLQITEEFTKRIKEINRIILVDDVITTGSTARAAEKALGASKIEMWCLADRRQLAASP